MEVNQEQELERKKEDYEYFYDESNEDDEDDVDSIYTNVLTKNNERKQIPYLYMLGRRCHPVHDYYERKEYEASLFWWTYRYDFPEIKPYCITSDAGWGCMLRSAQMMLTHALRIHFKSRHWKAETSITKAREDDFVKVLLTWFADFPSTSQSIYSLHNMCAAGLAKYEVLPGMSLFCSFVWHVSSLFSLFLSLSYTSLYPFSFVPLLFLLSLQYYATWTSKVNGTGQARHVM